MNKDYISTDPMLDGSPIRESDNLRAEVERLRAALAGKPVIKSEWEQMCERAEQAEAEVERLRAEVKRLDALDDANIVMLQGEVEEKERYKSRMVQAEARLAKVVEALKGAVSLIESTDWLAFSLSDKAKLDAARAAITWSEEPKPHAFEWAPADQQESHCCRCGKGIEDHASQR